MVFILPWGVIFHSLKEHYDTSIFSVKCPVIFVLSPFSYLLAYYFAFLVFMLKAF